MAENVHKYDTCHVSKIENGSKTLNKKRSESLYCYFVSRIIIITYVRKVVTGYWICLLAIYAMGLLSDYRIYLAGTLALFIKLGTETAIS